MDIILIVHEIALILALITGIIYIFKKNKGIKVSHFTSTIITILSIIIYLIKDGFSHTGYNIYGLLLLLVFSSMFLKKRNVILHVSLFIIAVVWLVLIHII